MHVKITNHKTNREFAGSFESRELAEAWVANHKAKGADAKKVYSPAKIEGAEVLGVEDTPFGKTYKLLIPADYTVEYFDRDSSADLSKYQALKARIEHILDKTDWLFVSDVQITPEWRVLYRDYRKQLRELHNRELPYFVKTEFRLESFEEYLRREQPNQFLDGGKGHKIIAKFMAKIK